MSKNTSNTISGVLGFAVVLLVVAIVAALSMKPVNMAELDGYRTEDNLMGIENAGDYGYYGDYLQGMFVVSENSPIGPEAAY